MQNGVVGFERHIIELRVWDVFAVLRVKLVPRVVVVVVGAEDGEPKLGKGVLNQLNVNNKVH